VAGTRFLLSDESRAHPAYKERAAAAGETVLTELFGAGWPAPHRVIANAATRRWLREGEARVPAAVRALHRLTGPSGRYLPAALQARLARAQRPGSPLLSPQPPTDDGPARLVDAGPLYAGETVRRLSEIRPAAALVRELTP
jgi:nitronate monooxygenase